MVENVRIPAIRSFYTAREGLVTLEDDVLSIVAQIHEEYGDRITVEMDPTTGWFHLVEHCEDQTHRLAFSVEELDSRVIDRLHRADSQGRGYEDPYDAAEREQDAIQDAHEQAMREKIREHGEEIAFALKKEGVMPRFPLQTSLYIPPTRRTRA